MALHAGSLSNIARNLRNNIPVVASYNGEEAPVYAATMVTPAEGEEGKPRLVLSMDAPQEETAPEPAPEGDQPPATGEADTPTPDANAPGYGNNG